MIQEYAGPKVIGTFKFGEYGMCDVMVCQYQVTLGVAIQLYGAAESAYPSEYIAHISACCDWANLPYGEFCVRTHQYGDDLIQSLLKCGLFEDTGKTVESGFVTMPVWRVL